ncbi:MAG: hypothetical protein K1X75_04455 [Leptospirales bacterium]|nr:hypothetical protein [Leptospirales bacterium]
MYCERCGAEIHVHLLTPDASGWSAGGYCPDCAELQVSSDRCRHCQWSFGLFRKTGQLGCEHCYQSFAARLSPMLEDYLGAPAAARAGKAPSAPGLARARSQEIREALLVQDSAHLPWRADEPGDSAGSSLTKDKGRQRLDEEICPGSVRLRVARNLRGVPYWRRLNPAQRETLSDMLLAPGAAAAQFIFAQSPHAAWRRQRRSFGCDRAALIAGDEDHLRAVWQSNAGLSWLQLEAWISATLEQCLELDRLLEWQFEPGLGFLCACPANSGSGMRCSIRLHIAGLQASGGWETWRDQLGSIGCELRWSGGEGSPPGDWLDLSWRRWPGTVTIQAALTQLLYLARRLHAAEIACQAR